MKRYFEKISFKQFKKDVSNDEVLYKEYLMPRRATKNSVAYDFLAIEDIVINPGEIIKVPTGIKAHFLFDEALILLTRSSLGFKYNLRLTNQVGLIECDYCDNETNEGHLWFSLQNEGKEVVVIKKGMAFGQGFFTKFLITDNDNATGIRTGGIGSTDRRDK